MGAPAGKRIAYSFCVVLRLTTCVFASLMSHTHMREHKHVHTCLYYVTTRLTSLFEKYRDNLDDTVLT